MSLPEHRAVEFRDAELDGMNFRGYAAVFDSPWNDGLTQALGYVESVARGAFRKAIGQRRRPPAVEPRPQRPAGNHQAATRCVCARTARGCWSKRPCRRQGSASTCAS